MDRSGTGIGGTSIVLIFTVLCFAFFALISYTAAGNDMALAEAELALVKGYYEADALAESIIAGLLAAETTLEELHGVDIKPGRDESEAVQTAEFSCAVSDRKELYVKIALKGDGYDILAWQLQDTDEWLPDTSMPVWPGV